MKHTINLSLPENAIDDKGNVLPNIVLDVFQKAADVHGRMLGVSFEEMLNKNLLWVITRIRYEVYGKAQNGQEVEVTTWPLKPTRMGYERDYVVSDLSGNVIIKGSSNWALIDADTRRLSMSGNVYLCDDFCEEHVFESRVKRIRNFEAEKQAGEIIPDASMIDLNNHVNNTYYAAFAEKALGGFEGEIKAFQIDYHHEVLCGQPLSMAVANVDGDVLVKGENSDGTLMFCSVVEYK